MRNFWSLLFAGGVQLNGPRTAFSPMGVTSENVAERFGIDRKEQDEAAVSC